MKTAHESGKWLLFLSMLSQKLFNLKDFYLAYGWVGKMILLGHIRDFKESSNSAV